jgi:hypothetical protein
VRCTLRTRNCLPTGLRLPLAGGHLMLLLLLLLRMPYA